MVVNPNRLRGRRHYPGTLYVDGKARTAEFSGADWRSRVTGLRLESVGDGTLHAYRGASLLMEIYEDGKPAVL